MLELRSFDTVFQKPYRYFSIVLKVVFSSSDRYKIFTSNWPWNEISENVVLRKIDITMTTINKKNFEIDKSLILCDLDQLLERHAYVDMFPYVYNGFVFLRPPLVQ